MRTKNPNTRAAPLAAEGKLEVENGFEIAYRVYGAGSRTLVGLHDLLLTLAATQSHEAQ